MSPIPLEHRRGRSGIPFAREGKVPECQAHSGGWRVPSSAPQHATQPGGEGLQPSRGGVSVAKLSFQIPFLILFIASPQIPFCLSPEGGKVASESPLPKKKKTHQHTPLGAHPPAGTPWKAKAAKKKPGFSPKAVPSAPRSPGARELARGAPSSGRAGLDRASGAPTAPLRGQIWSGRGARQGREPPGAQVRPGAPLGPGPAGSLRSSLPSVRPSAENKPPPAPSPHLGRSGSPPRRQPGSPAPVPHQCLQPRGCGAGLYFGGGDGGGSGV